MSESKRVVLRVVAFVCFDLGLILFLMETRSAGEALERFNLTVSQSPLAIVGAAVAIVALATLMVLYLWERKRHLGHL